MNEKLKFRLQIRIQHLIFSVQAKFNASSLADIDLKGVKSLKIKDLTVKNRWE